MCDAGVCDAGVCVMRVFVSYASVLLEGVIKDKERKFYAQRKMSCELRFSMNLKIN